MAKKNKHNQIDDENENEVDPVLRISWESACEMESVEISVAINGDPAGTLPGGSGTSGSADYPMPEGWPNQTDEYTFAWRGTTPLAGCTVTEVPGGGE